MAQTALLIRDRKLVVRSHVNPDNGKLNIVIANADENYIGQKDDQVQVFEHDDPDEAKFHTELRKEASAAGHLIIPYSTDPEWNPVVIEVKTEES